MKETLNIYSLPLPLDANITMVVKDSPGHIGKWQGAIDYAVTAGTVVLSPANGEVLEVVDSNDEYGNDVKFADKANYVQIQHENGEISDLLHLAKGSIVVAKGEQVKQGQIIGKTGLSGWMTEPHLHWFVFRKADNKHGLEGLEIQIEE